MKTLLTLVLVSAIFALTIVTLIFANIAIANAQQVSSQSTRVQQEGKKFQSISDGFSISVPAGWVVQDVSSIDTSSLLTEMLQGYRILAQLCPEQQALHDNGGRYNCDEAQDLLYINQYPKLADEPEFASIANNNNNIIANEDFLKYQIRKLQEIGYSDIKIVNNTDVSINITNTDTNKTIAKVPANLVEMTYTKNSTETRGYFLLSATNATSNTRIISGYRIFYEADAAKMPSASPPEWIKQVFQSFEFVKGQGEGESVVAAGDAAKNPANSTGSTTQQPAILLPSAFLQYYRLLPPHQAAEIRTI
jgi:hypothetical protein